MRACLRFSLFALVFCLAVSPAAHAQLGVYGQFSTTSSSSPRLYGGTFGAFYDSKHFPVAHFGIDLRGSTLHGTQNGFETSITSGAAGPRIAFHLPVVHPYGEILVGAAHRYSGPGPTTYDRTGFSASGVAGADLHLFPFISWRVIDYSFTRVPNRDLHNLSTGIVVRIPFS